MDSAEIAPPLTLTLRPARPSDYDAVSHLLAGSYPALLGPDYSPGVLRDALPLITRANPRLLASGTFHLAFAGEELVGAGGWSWIGPHGALGPRHMAHIRHVVTHRDHQRRGIARALIGHCLDEARAQGARILNCQSTLTAAPFYAAMGFRRIAAIEVHLRPGVVLPGVHLQKCLGVAGCAAA